MKKIEYCMKCQAAINMKKNDREPFQLIIELEFFYLWGIHFMGPFPISNGYEYGLMARNYVSRSIELFLQESMMIKYP